MAKPSWREYSKIIQAGAHNEKLALLLQEVSLYLRRFNIQKFGFERALKVAKRMFELNKEKSEVPDAVFKICIERIKFLIDNGNDEMYEHFWRDIVIVWSTIFEFFDGCPREDYFRGIFVDIRKFGLLMLDTLYKV